MQDKYKEVIVTVIVSCTLFMALCGIVLFFILFYQKKRIQHNQEMLVLQNSIQQELLKAQLEAQEMAFQQIAQEIHDNVGQLLNTVKNMLGVLGRSLPQGEYSILNTSMNTLGKAIDELRSMSKSLNKDWLHQFDLIENLQLEIDRINTAGPVLVQLFAGAVVVTLKAEEQIMLFRIMQEALQNCIKHSGASGIAITMKVTAENFSIKIADNGTGFNAAAPPKNGIGLMNMKNRTRMLGGEITWASAENQGTEVNIVLPVKKTLP